MMPDPTLSPDAAQIKKHLAHITRRWGELNLPCMLEVVFLTAHDKAEVRHVARFNWDDAGLTEAAQHVADMNQHKLNAYAVVNPVDGMKTLTAGRRASTNDIVASFFHFADADDAQAAENIRNFVGPKCTFFVLTGTIPSPRPHVYWELEEPVFDMAEWSKRQATIAAVLKTDSVIDAPRIMRLGGTINWPKPKKQERGYVVELTTIKIYTPEERPPVSVERITRAFGGAAQPSLSQQALANVRAPGGIQIDVGGENSGRVSLNRDAMAMQALQGQEWHNAVIRLVGSYVAKGLTDGEIHAITDGFTLSGYTVEDTRREVQTAIDGARRKGWTPEPQTQHTPNFDYAPAPTPSDPTPQVKTWRMQTAAEFTADFVAPEYIVDGVMQRGRLYTLTAPTGSGKTAVMLYAATTIAEGQLFYDREVEQGDVIFMAGENPDDVRARMIGTMEFNGIDPKKCRVHFIPGTFSIRADVERLREEAAKLPNLVLIVIDTFAAYFDGDDENSNAQALDFARVARRLTEFPSKPMVVMPAHPVKNATRGNLSPKGGSSLLNEVDGNLTLWNEGGVVTMHWQGKFRGAEFDPLSFELQRHESDLIRDAKGRRMPTILAKPMLTMRAMQIAKDNMSMEDKLLLSIADAPALSLAERAVTIGAPHKMKVARMLEKMAQQKLIRKFRTNWELTKDGERAVEIITSGGQFAPEI